jgi:tripartite-type tricarboxylate transporter receptor subunit TctC
MRGKRLVVCLAVALVVAPGIGWGAAAFPEREVTVIVPTSAGGGSDLTMRAIARATEPILGKPVVVVNRPGAGGAIGHAEIARAKVDGYQLGMLLQQMTIVPMMRPEVPFRWTDFKPIIMINADAAALIVREGGRWNTLKEFVEYVQKNPGVVTVADCGVGCIWQIAAAGFASTAKLKVNHVPFEGAAPERIALLGGHVDAMVASVPEVADQVRAKKMRILAVMDERRDPNFPDVPTLKEQGYPVSIVAWRAIGGPKDLPDDLVKKLHDAFRQGMQQAAYTDFMKKQGLGIVYKGTEDTAKFIDQERKDFKALLKSLGLLKLED